MSTQRTRGQSRNRSSPSAGARRRTALAGAGRRAAASTRLGGLAFCWSPWSARSGSPTRRNAGKFFDRLPHLFDFFSMLMPRDWTEVWRALFDLPSPYDDGSLKFNYPDGRVYLIGGLLHSRIFLQDARDAQHRAGLDADRLHLRLPALLPRRAQSRRQPLAALSSSRASWKCCAPFRKSSSPASSSAIFSLGADPGHHRRRPSTRSARWASCSSRSSRTPTCSRTRACGRSAPTGPSGSGSAIVPQVMPNFISLFPAAARDQRPRLDHHRRRRRRRHRRGPAAVDLARA